MAAAEFNQEAARAEILRQNRDRTFSCPVCSKRFDDPRLLPCKDTACLNCLKELLTTAEGEAAVPAVIKCPSCSKVHRLDMAVDDLPKNDHVAHLVSLLPNDPLPLVSHCQGCDNDEAEAKGFCEMCLINLCQPCIDYHGKSLYFRGHVIRLLQDMDGTGVDLRPVKPITHEAPCEKHFGEQREIFCVVHKVSMCKKCTAEEHQTCVTMSVQEHFDTKRTELKTMEQALNRGALSRAKKNLETTQKELIGFLGRTRDIKARIKADTTNLVRGIKEYEAAMLEFVEAQEQRERAENEEKRLLLVSQINDITNMELATRDLALNFLKVDVITHAEGFAQAIAECQQKTSEARMCRSIVFSPLTKLNPPRAPSRTPGTVSLSLPSVKIGEYEYDQAQHKAQLLAYLNPPPQRGNNRP